MPEQVTDVVAGDDGQASAAKLLDELGLELGEIADLCMHDSSIERDMLLAFGAEGSALRRPAAELFASLAESDGEAEGEDDEEDLIASAAEDGGDEQGEEQFDAPCGVGAAGEGEQDDASHASLGVEGYGNWCFRSAATGKNLGNIRRVNGKSLKALCHIHKSCACWVTIRTVAGECTLEHDLVRWLSQAPLSAHEQHAESSYELKLKYGMKPKPMRA